MKILDIIYNYGKGLVTSGKILYIFLGILVLAFGFVLATILYIFKIGYKVFIIFLDESLYFSIRGYEYLDKNVEHLKSLFEYLFYLLSKFSKALLPEKIDIPSKPDIEKNVLWVILFNFLRSIFYYGISLMIVFISIYWLITYIEIICRLGDFILLLLNTKYTLITTLKHLLNSIEEFVYHRTSINIFDLFIVWLIRIIGFITIFWFRYYRFKKYDESIDYTMIFPFRSAFSNKYWSSQSSVEIKYKVAFITIFSSLILLAVLGFIYVEFNNYEDNKKAIVQIDSSSDQHNERENSAFESYSNHKKRLRKMMDSTSSIPKPMNFENYQITPWRYENLNLHDTFYEQKYCYFFNKLKDRGFVAIVFKNIPLTYLHLREAGFWGGFLFYLIDITIPLCMIILIVWLAFGSKSKDDEIEWEIAVPIWTIIGYIIFLLLQSGSIWLGYLIYS